MNGFDANKAAGFRQWLQIYLLYRESFPRSERKPFSMILSMWKKGKTDVWFYSRDGRFSGFAATINGENLILLDYLAVVPRRRGRGDGSCMMASLKENYSGKGLFVEIESPFEDVPDRTERMRRRRFYEKSGMTAMRVMADVFGVRMELLGINCAVDFDTYRSFYRDNYSEYAARNIIEAAYPSDIDYLL